MTKTIMLAVTAALALECAALEGTDTFAIGPYAGDNAKADRTVFIGNGAGYYAGNDEVNGMYYTTSIDSNLFIGAASALRAQDVTSSVGMGHYAFRMARDMRNCVGIGDLAFSSARGRTNEVWINGQIFVGPRRFYIKPDPAAEPLMEWDGEELRINGATLNQDGTGGGQILDYDFYVDGERGDDSNSGIVRGEPVKTIGRAYTVATNGARIAVLSGGAYTVPNSMGGKSAAVTKHLRWVALMGPNETTLDLGGDKGLHGRLDGGSVYYSWFRGFTIRDPMTQGDGYGGVNVTRSAFFGCVFESCVLTGMNGMKVSASGSPFAWCILDDCRVDGMSVVSPAASYDNSYQVFKACDVYNSRIDWTTTGNAPYPVAFGLSVVSSSFVTVDKLRMIFYTRENQPFGLIDSTMLADSVETVANYAETSGAWLTRNSAFGIATNASDAAKLTASGNLVTNRATLAACINAAGEVTRPVPWRVYGRNSADYRLQMEEWRTAATDLFNPLTNAMSAAEAPAFFTIRGTNAGGEEKLFRITVEGGALTATQVNTGASLMGGGAPTPEEPVEGDFQPPAWNAEISKPVPAD